VAGRERSGRKKSELFSIRKHFARTLFGAKGCGEEEIGGVSNASRIKGSGEVRGESGKFVGLVR